MLYIMHMLYVIRLITFSKYLLERILHIDAGKYLFNIHSLFIFHETQRIL